MPSFIHYTLSSKQMSHIFYLCKIVITITHKKQKGRKSIGNSSLTKEFISAKKISLATLHLVEQILKNNYLSI